MLRVLLIWLLIWATTITLMWTAWPAGASDRLALQRTQLTMVAPVMAGALALGTLLGLWRRERVRSGEGYSSPMLAWLGKRLLLASACAVAAYAFGPVAVESDWLYAAATGLAAGAAAYAGNLPTRL